MQPPTSIEHLPNEVVVMVLERLTDCRSRARSSEVCRRWRELYPRLRTPKKVRIRLKPCLSHVRLRWAESGSELQVFGDHHHFHYHFVDNIGVYRNVSQSGFYDLKIDGRSDHHGDTILDDFVFYFDNVRMVPKHPFKLVLYPRTAEEEGFCTSVTITLVPD